MANNCDTDEVENRFPVREDVHEAAVRVMQRCDELATCSEDSKCLTRTFCCGAMQRAHDLVRSWMRDIGMSTRFDALGNLVGRYEPHAGTRKVFLVGSHLDTVVNAGRFDGALGVVLGIGTVELLRNVTAKLPFALDVVGFSEEEGVRFNTPFLGSRAAAGVFDPGLFQLADINGCTVRQALIDFGANPDDLTASCYSPQELIGFLEPHIEQGPILDRAQQPAAVVSAIAGQTRAAFQFQGTAGHAGTVPHGLRHDALAAAAEFVTRVEQLGQTTDGLFATVGNIVVEPNVSNVIAQQAQVRLDLRHEYDNVRLEAFDQIQGFADDCARRRGVAAEVIQCEQQPAVPMNAELTAELEAVFPEAGLSRHRLVSGAGHDAVMLARLVPTAMLFIRCRDGVSHHPDESVDVADVEVALEVLLRLFTRLSKRNRSHPRTDQL